jgi:hypothetical protein
MCCVRDTSLHLQHTRTWEIRHTSGSSHKSHLNIKTAAGTMVYCQKSATTGRFSHISTFAHGNRAGPARTTSTSVHTWARGSQRHIFCPPHCSHFTAQTVTPTCVCADVRLHRRACASITDRKVRLLASFSSAYMYIARFVQMARSNPFSRSISDIRKSRIRSLRHPKNLESTSS